MKNFNFLFRVHRKVISFPAFLQSAKSRHWLSSVYTHVEAFMQHAGKLLQILHLVFSAFSSFSYLIVSIRHMKWCAMQGDIFFI